jgi:hypothetical protein
VKTDYFYPELNFDNGQPLQLDICVPSHKIAFEFQGEQHYDTCLMLGKVQHSGMSKEQSKKEVCERVGVTLVEVCLPLLLGQVFIFSP